MVNLVTTPRKFKNKALLIGLEDEYGVDAVLTGALNWIEARNISFTPMDVDKVARNIEMPYMGNTGDVIVGTWSKLSFDVAMVPSGALGVAPKWAPLLLGCSWAETVTAVTSVVYNLVSKDVVSLCAYMNIDGVLHKLLGMRGEVKAKMSAKGIPMLSFSYDSLYMVPVDGPMPTVTRTGWMLEEGVNSVNTGPAVINSVPTAFSAFDWSLGNKVDRIDLPGPQLLVDISDRAPQASITIMAPDLATFNPFALVQSGATVPLTTTHGKAPGRKIKTDMHVRIINADYDQIDGSTAYKLTLQPAPVAGNDEIVITCL